MKTRFFRFSRLTALMIPISFSLTGCLSGAGNQPFPVGGGGAPASAGQVLPPAAPAGTMTSSKISTLTGGSGGVTNANKLANPNSGGPSSVTSGLGNVPGFNSLGFESGGFFQPLRLPEDPTSFSNSVLANCIQTMGNTQDSDSDGIPRLLGYTFNCGLVNNGNPFSFSGSIYYSDENDSLAFPGAGYSLVYDNLRYVSESGGYHFDNTFNGSFRYWIEGNTYRLTAGFENIFETDAYWEQSGTYGYYMDWAMTPTNPGSPYTAGSIEFSGYYQDTLSTNLVLEYFTTNLTYAVGCGSFYNNGSITYVDGSGNRLVFTFTNCTQSVTFNGSTVP